VRIACVGALADRAVHDLGELARKIRSNLAQGNRVSMEQPVEHLHRVRALEGRPAGRHLVQQAPEGEDVAARVDLLAERLLG
jgi:hypothetical protein